MTIEDEAVLGNDEEGFNFGLTMKTKLFDDYNKEGRIIEDLQSSSVVDKTEDYNETNQTLNLRDVMSIRSRKKHDLNQSKF